MQQLLSDHRVVKLDRPVLDLVRSWPRNRGLLVLYSARFHPRWARWSLIAEPAGFYRFLSLETDEPVPAWPPPGRSVLEMCLATSCAPAPPTFQHQPWPDLRQILKWPGIWVGYLAYDLGRWIEKLPQRAKNDRSWPLIELAWCPGWVIFDQARQQWYAGGSWATDPKPLAWLKTDPLHLSSSIDETGQFPRLLQPPQSVFDRRRYEAAVQRVIDYIAAGDVYQVNLAQRFTACLAGDPVDGPRQLFCRLMEICPAWYGAYLELGQGRRIVSSSPELFLEVDGSSVVTRPIKGTRPASVPAQVLLESQKDVAELNMIVDLLRNDLGRVCRYGSVRVLSARQIETHPTVHHGVATIGGQLRTDCDVADLLQASFPGGSVTGAPKIRAMEIIDELEPVRRGPYCGALGLLSRDYAILSMIIRTLLVEPHPHAGDQAGRPAANGRQTLRLDFSVGGGIVADSDPAQEYQETLDKAAAILQTLSTGP